MAFDNNKYISLPLLSALPTIIMVNNNNNNININNNNNIINNNNYGIYRALNTVQVNTDTIMYRNKIKKHANKSYK